MPPIPYCDLVVGQEYVRVYRNNPHEHTFPQKYIGLWIDFQGRIFIEFEAGPSGVADGHTVSYNVELYDVYTPGEEPIIAAPLMAVPLPLGYLNTTAAVNIGTLTEGTDVLLTEDVDSISHEPFQDGDICIQIVHPTGNVTLLNPAHKGFVYHAESLQQWFNLGNKEEPRTRLILAQADLKRFTYHAQ